MTHPLKDYAHGVQDELARNTSTARRSYQWCLHQVEANYERAKELASLDGKSSVTPHREFRAAVVVKLVEMIEAQLAAKSKPPNM